MAAKKTSPPPAPAAPPPSEDSLNRLDFDSLEEKIRGEEILVESETRSQREAHDVKKKLDASEVDRRLQELKRKIGAKK